MTVPERGAAHPGPAPGGSDATQVVSPAAAPSRVRVALDLLGGDGAPEVVVDAVALLRTADPGGEGGASSPAAAGLGVDLVLVGPPDLARAALAARGVDPDAPGLAYVPAATAVAMDDDALRVVRARRDVSIRVATGLVHAGHADAVVSAGHTGAAVASSLFTLGRLRGVTRPALAVVLPALAGPVVLLDCGASPDATPDLLAQFALAGSAYARALGIADPRVGLLTIGAEPGKGDGTRRDADRLLAGLPITYAGPVEGHDVATGARADVVVTDGFTGNVLLKGLEGAVAWAAERLGAAYGDRGPARAAALAVATGEFAGGMLLGVDGVCVVGHGASSPDSLVACIGMAARAVRRDLVGETARELGGLVAHRRAAAGLDPRPPSLPAAEGGPVVLPAAEGGSVVLPAAEGGPA